MKDSKLIRHHADSLVEAAWALQQSANRIREYAARLSERLAEGADPGDCALPPVADIAAQAGRVTFIGAQVDQAITIAFYNANPETRGV